MVAPSQPGYPHNSDSKGALITSAPIPMAIRLPKKPWQPQFVLQLTRMTPRLQRSQDSS